jgi:hypothetical protein
MSRRRIRRGLLVAGSTLAVLIPVNAASAACVARPLAGKQVGNSATTTVLTLPGFMRATLICTTVRGQRGLRGFRGSVGASGAHGARGVVGGEGLIGATGLQGVIGATGPTGLRGLTGADGATGPQGAPGAAGSPGLQGIPGTPGGQGPRGLIGYASVSNEGAQSIAGEAPVTFSGAGTVSSGFTHIAGAAEITVASAGVYEIRFEVIPFQASQLALFVNGAVAPGTTFGNPTANQNSGQAILVLGAGDVLTLRNHTSAGAITLLASTGGSATNENASIVIEQLA